MYSRHIKRQSRDKFCLFSLITRFLEMCSNILLPARIPGHLLTLFPAIFYGCSTEILPESSFPLQAVPKVEVMIKNHVQILEGSTLDILTFENDRFRRLDSYKRVENFDSTEGIVESTGGDKIMFFCLNAQRERLDWADISSYWSLGKIYCDLELERMDRLTMTGQCTGLAGEESLSTHLEPLACMTRIDRINCDFGGTTYSSKRLKNVKAYLINVNATYEIGAENSQSSQRMVNVEMFNQIDVNGFIEKENIMSEISDEVGKEWVYPKACFLCYPNTGDDTSPSSQMTRLVIEGRVGDETYYWPININGGKVERNNCYAYSITIRRKGVTDPNIPIDVVETDIIMTRSPWIENEEYVVGF